jgi:hypothetical protein
MRSGILILILICLFLTACDSTQLATIPPSPQPILITLPPYLAPITDALQSCANGHDEFAVILNTSTSSQLDNEPEELSLWLGENPGSESYAIPIAQDELIIIVNQLNPNDAITLEQLRAIFAGQVENWSDLSDYQEPIVIWIYPEGNQLSQIFKSELLDGIRFSPLAHIAPSPESVVSAVANDPGAIGFVLQSFMKDGVTRISVESELDLALKKPILALTDTEPQGGLRALMICLQSGSGQSTLLESYSPIQ